MSISKRSPTSIMPFSKDRNAGNQKRSKNYVHLFRSFAIVFVGSPDTFDQAMDTEVFETTGDLSGGKVAQMMSEIFVSQSIDRILSAAGTRTEYPRRRKSPDLRQSRRYEFVNRSKRFVY